MKTTQKALAASQRTVQLGQGRKSPRPLSDRPRQSAGSGKLTHFDGVYVGPAAPKMLHFH